MRDELLALLETGPSSTAQLAAWLDQPRIAVAHALNALAALGLTRKVGTAKRWCLAGYVARVGRTPNPARPPRVKPIAAPASPRHTTPLDSSLRRQGPPRPGAIEFREARGSGGRLARRNAAGRVDALLGIRELSTGTALCLHCFQRFTPDRAGEDFCTDAHRELGPAWGSGTRTLVVDGQEYDVESIGGRPVTEWPETSLSRGSSLTDAHRLVKS